MLLVSQVAFLNMLALHLKCLSQITQLYVEHLLFLCVAFIRNGGRVILQIHARSSCVGQESC